MRLGDLLGREVVRESGERLGVGARGKGGARRAKRHGHAAIAWERVVHVGPEVVIRD